jgi:hypothetical protein
MKKILLFVSVLAFCLTGCLDSEEDVTIQPDGSGVYKTTIDMSGLFDMMQMMAMMDTSANSQLKELADKNIDSTFAVSSFTDTSTTLTSEEKALLKNGTVHMTINQADKIFKVVMNYPFSKVEDIEKIVALQKSGKSFNPLGNTKENTEMGEMGDKGLPSADEISNISFKKGLIERKVDPQKLADLKNDNQFKDMMQADQMLTQVTFTTSIHLPKAAKTATGEKLKLSDDKKTVRVNYTLLDMVKNPGALEFKVEY